MVVNRLDSQLSFSLCLFLILCLLSLIFASDSAPEAFNFVTDLGLLDLLFGLGGVFRYGVACHFSSYLRSLISFFEVLDGLGLLEDDAVHGGHVLGAVPLSCFRLVLLGDARFVLDLVLLEQFK